MKELNEQVALDLLKKISERKLENYKMEIAASINNLLNQAIKHQWGEQYVNAIKDVQKNVLKFKGTIYELVDGGGE